jgi:hypothetical protein
MVLASKASVVLIVCGIVALLVAPLASAASDYISTPPATVYENPAMSPQTMDYDKLNKTFIAHPGWIQDRLIHYYKFRMYTPGTYPNKVVPGSAPNIPIGELYLLSTNNAFSGIVAGQMPIVRWHTADGENYSDFVEVVWAQVSGGYQANAYKSYGDLVGNNTVLTPSGIYANLPVVPIGSRLQDPSGSGFSPITPLMVWYRGVEIQAFVFETTNQAFANYFNPITRTGAASLAGSGYEITVANFVTNRQVATIPIWHLNQYSYGVTPGVNNGGPWRGGERNIVDQDRGDPGYTPLWQVFWVSKVPVDYRADMASSASQVTTENGFEVLQAPMYVNCPNVGPVHGSTANPNKATTFGKGQVVPGERLVIQGALVMQGGATIDAYVGAAKVASATTSMMGAYEFDLSADTLAQGTNTITVKDASGNALQTLSLTKTSVGLAGVPVGILAAVAVVIIAALLVGVTWQMRRRKGKRDPPEVRPPEDPTEKP